MIEAPAAGRALDVSTIPGPAPVTRTWEPHRAASSRAGLPPSGGQGMTEVAPAGLGAAECPWRRGWAAPRRSAMPAGAGAPQGLQRAVASAPEGALSAPLAPAP